MEAYQERVVVEEKELAEKIDKLEIFLDSSTFAGLPDYEQALLRIQCTLMKAYLKTLSDRIEFFIANNI